MSRLKQGDAALKKLKESDELLANPLIKTLREIAEARKWVVSRVLSTGWNDVFCSVLFCLLREMEACNFP